MFLVQKNGPYVRFLLGAKNINSIFILSNIYD
ncbi:MAG: hypothetical protein RIR11_2423 [Bacteroidota bacterium]|jgi:hypothetical protein